MPDSPAVSPTDLLHPALRPPPARVPSSELFDPAFSFRRPAPTDELERPPARPARRGTFDIAHTPGPIPPSLRAYLSSPDDSSRGGSLSLIALGQTLGLPQPGAAMGQHVRPPSPLPPPLTGAIPTEIQDMSARLAELIAQSNEYVRGLAHRIETLERERDSLTGAATVEALSVFIETRPRFAGLDVERIASFGLPLHVWQHIGATVLSEHANDERGLENILYWRGRAEAEAMGLLVSDHRSSLASVDESAYGPSPRSSYSLSGSGGRRPSGSDLGVPPRRPSARTARSFTSVVSANSSNESRRPSPSAGV